MTLTQVTVYFSNSIDNDTEKGGYKFNTKKEALAILATLTTNETKNYEWYDDNEPGDLEPYYYLGFTEMVEVTIEDDGSPLYTQLDKNISGQVPGGVYKSNKRKIIKK